MATAVVAVAVTPSQQKSKREENRWRRRRKIIDIVTLRPSTNYIPNKQTKKREQIGDKKKKIVESPRVHSNYIWHLENNRFLPLLLRRHFFSTCPLCFFFSFHCKHCIQHSTAERRKSAIPKSQSTEAGAHHSRLIPNFVSHLFSIYNISFHSSQRWSGKTQFISLSFLLLSSELSRFSVCVCSWCICLYLANVKDSHTSK